MSNVEQEVSKDTALESEQKYQKIKKVFLKEQSMRRNIWKRVTTSRKKLSKWW